MAFYATVATFIPVLYLALAVQGNASQSMFGAARAIMKPIIRSLTRSFFRNAITDRPQKKTETIRRRTIATRRIIICAVACTIPLGAVLIIIAGTWGETLAVYALYQGQDSPPTRTIVLLTAIFLISAVAAGPAITFVKIAYAFVQQIFKDVAKEFGGVAKEVIVKEVGGVVKDVIVKEVGGGMTKKYRDITKNYQATAEKFLRALEKNLPPESPGSSSAEADRAEIGQTDSAQDQK